ncbi:hypothetical protein [Runella sp.]|uniref:hypothetical protein n=1 Tax=Runella sp. TaxID=1960881 RepID=UPI003D1091E2
MLDKLREIAFRFQIDPDKTVGHAARISSVISVLSSINQSFQSFLEVEFFKNEDFVKAYEQSNKVLDSLKEDLELLIVDLKFSSFEAAAVPNIISPPSLFNDHVNRWKKETYEDYKENILYGDYEDPKYLRKVLDRFSDIERNQIFKPLFSAVSPERPYKLNLLNEGVKKVLKQPAKNLYSFYVPKVKKSKINESVHKIVQFYAQVRKDENGYSLSKKNIKQVYFWEELDHETYPYKPNTIAFENTVYILNKRIDCQVEFEDGMYVIQNLEYDITVWGETREEAEYSFGFTFHSLYQNFALEEDKKLSKAAILLKENLIKTVKKVINESQKS